MYSKEKIEEKSVGNKAFDALIKCSSIVFDEVRKSEIMQKLTPSQYAILETLYLMGPQYQRDLAKYILKTTGNITTVIDNLEKQKLVKRKRGEDRRFYQVVLTPKGRKFIKNIYPERQNNVDAIMKRLTKTEQDRLISLCAKLCES